MPSNLDKSLDQLRRRRKNPIKISRRQPIITRLELYAKSEIQLSQAPPLARTTVVQLGLAPQPAILYKSDGQNLPPG